MTKIKVGDLVVVRCESNPFYPAPRKKGDAGLVLKTHNALFGCESEYICVVKWCKTMGHTTELSSQLQKANL